MESQQYQLFHESIYKALDTCVQALGGAKEVGSELWGQSTTPDKLGEKLNDCLNPNRAQKLSLEELLFILRKAHDIGCHAGINFICRDTGYTDPQPVDLEDEIAQREREFIQAVNSLQKLAGDVTTLREQKQNIRAIG
jgi:hypothetical protein